MTDTIAQTVPGMLKTLLNLENELRSAAQNGVILRGDEARSHLKQARFHLDQLLGISSEQSDGDQSEEISRPVKTHTSET